jgi:hypothetical protein
LTIVRDRRDARWLPSRFHFALFRLYAYMRLRAAKPEPARGLILSVDRHQSASENFLSTICIVLVAGSYFGAWFETSMVTPVAYAAGLLAAVIAIQALIAVAGAIIVAIQKPDGAGTAATLMPIVIMAAMIAGGAAVATGDSSARYIARGFLLLVAMNAAAAVVTFLLREQITEAERQFGVER